MNNLIWRLIAPKPSFWKRVQIFGGSLGALSASLIAIPHVPASVVNASGYLLVAGAVIAALAQFACTNAPDTSATNNSTDNSTPVVDKFVVSQEAKGK